MTDVELGLRRCYGPVRYLREAPTDAQSFRPGLRCGETTQRVPRRPAQPLWITREDHLIAQEGHGWGGFASSCLPEHPDGHGEQAGRRSLNALAVMEHDLEGTLGGILTLAAGRKTPVHPEDERVRWLRGPDLNQRPSGYEPDELPDCSTPRRCKGDSTASQRTLSSAQVTASPQKAA